MEHESDGDTNRNWGAPNIPERLGKGRFGKWRTIRDHPNYSIVRIRQNPEKSPGDQRRLDGTPVNDHQLTLVGKTLIMTNNDDDNKSHQRNKHLSSPPCVIISITLIMEKRGTKEQGYS